MLVLRVTLGNIPRGVCLDPVCFTRALYHGLVETYPYTGMDNSQEANSVIKVLTRRLSG